MLTVIEMSPLDPEEYSKEYSTDLDLSVYDDLRVYAEEGVGSLASSLSSLATGKPYFTSFCSKCVVFYIHVFDKPHDGSSVLFFGL